MTVIIKQDITEKMSEAYLTYSLSVIKDRAIPFLEDGLKPVQRKVIYAMYDLGLFNNRQHKKSARIVGETIGKYSPHGDCLKGDTKVFLAKGDITTIEELYKKNQSEHIIAINEDRIPEIVLAHSFRIGQYTNEIYKIKFSNNSYIEVTGNHQVMLDDGCWKQAKELKQNDLLFSSILNIDLNDDQCRPLLHVNFSKHKNYFLQNLAVKCEKGFHRHHIDKRPINNVPGNLELHSPSEHAKLHGELGLFGLEKGRNSMKTKFKEKIRIKNSFLISEFNKKQPLISAIKIIRKIQSEGLIPSEELYEQFRNGRARFSKLLEKKYINNFDELVSISKVDKKHTNFDKRIYAENNLQISNKELYKSRGWVDRKNLIRHRIFKIFLYMLKNDFLPSHEKYYFYREKYIQEYGLGHGNIHERFFPNENSISEYEINLQELETEFKEFFPYITSIEKIKVDNEPMYDFTVDNHQNMIIPIKSFNNKFSMITVHNSSTYSALVNLVQDFKMRYPLIDGQGNFGSIDDDPAAAMRYTEAKLSKYAELMLKDLENNVVEFVDNFDGTLKEPTVLPSILPNILLNGTNGIAVGMATCLLPHNMKEVIDAMILLVKKPGSNLNDLLQYVKGPDFPTGGHMFIEDIKTMYETGYGSVRIRAKLHLEGNKVIVTEIPYQIDKTSILKQIALAVQERKIEGITNLKDESDKDGLRVSIEFNPKIIDPDNLIKQLYQKTKLESSMKMNNMILVDGVPQQLGLLQILNLFLKFRKKIVQNRFKNELQIVEDKHHIIKGIVVALNDIDKVIETIKASRNQREATIKLQRVFDLSSQQAKAILEIRLSKLIQMEVKKSLDELKSLECRIEELKELLSDHEKFDDFLIKEFKQVKTDLGDDRKTEVINDFCEMDFSEKEFHLVYTYDNEFIVSESKITYPVKFECKCSSTSYVNVITEDGEMHIDVPEKLKDCDFKKVIYLGVHEENNSYFGVTAQGNIAFTRSRNKSGPYINLDDGDKLVAVSDSIGKTALFLTKLGSGLKIDTTLIRLSGPGVKGVKGMNLKKEDEIRSVLFFDDDCQIVYLTKKKYIKVINTSDVPLQGRGGKGVIMNRLTEDTGFFYKGYLYGEDIYISKQDKLINIDYSGLSATDRYHKGEKLNI